MATVTEAYCISEGSGKETNHYVVSLKGSGIRYKPGDSLGFYPTNNYELDGDIKINNISFNFGHQWIRDWFSVDLHIGLAHYGLQYDFEEESGSYDDYDDREQMWLPRMGLNLGVAF